MAAGDCLGAASLFAPEASATLVVVVAVALARLAESGTEAVVATGIDERLGSGCGCFAECARGLTSDGEGATGTDLRIAIVRRAHVASWAGRASDSSSEGVRSSSALSHHSSLRIAYALVTCGTEVSPVELGFGAFHAVAASNGIARWVRTIGSHRAVGTSSRGAC